MSVSKRFLCEVRHLYSAGVQTFQISATYPGSPLSLSLKSLLVRCRSSNREVGSQPCKVVFSEPRSFPTAGGAAVVFITVQGSEQPSQKGNQAGRGCGRQLSDLFGHATLVPSAPSAQTILLYRISSCWMPSIQSCIRAERKGH